MAKTVKEIQDIIIASVQADTTLSTRLTSTSATAIWRLTTYAMAFCWAMLENIFDTLVIEINDLLSRLKPHTLRWYVEKLKNFQYGYSLPADTDVYDNTGLTDAVVAASKIIQYAAGARQRRTNGRLFLRLKVAKLVAGDLGALAGAEIAAVSDYTFRIADAGVDYEITSGPADKIVQKWTIYYDPEMIDGTGNRIDGTVSEPVKNGIKNYLLNLPFNGEYRTTYHVDAVQLIPGVTDCKLEECQASYGALPLTSIAVSYTPDAGYMRFYADTDLVIIYQPLSPIK